MEGTEQAFRFTGGNKRDEIPIVPDLLSGRTGIDKSSFYDVSAGRDLCNNSYFVIFLVKNLAKIFIKRKVRYTL